MTEQSKPVYRHPNKGRTGTPPKAFQFYEYESIHRKRLGFTA